MRSGGSLPCSDVRRQRQNIPSSHFFLVSKCLCGREMQGEFSPVAGLGHLKTSNQVSTVKSDMIWYWKYKGGKKLLTQALKRHILNWPDMSDENILTRLIYSAQQLWLKTNNKMAQFYNSFWLSEGKVHSKINVLSLFTHPWKNEVAAKEQHKGE